MNAVEFIKYSLGTDMKYEFDECGNCYIYSESYRMTDMAYLLERTETGEVFFLDKDKMDKVLEYEIIVPDEFIEYECLARRPYYRMRGKKVSEEQAMDIIRKTDNFFEYDTRQKPPTGYIGNMNFDNWLISKRHYPMGYGWIHRDGTVGGNAITQKFPTVYEFVIEWLKKLMTFPYLDLIIGVTYYDEGMKHYYDEEYEYWFEHLQEEKYDYFEKEEYDERFYSNLEVGIYVHDKKIEILDQKQTKKIYREYAEKYGDKDRYKYCSEYYDANEIEQIDNEYLKKCLELDGWDEERIEKILEDRK